MHRLLLPSLLLLAAAPSQAQGTAAVHATTSLFDAATLRGTQALYPGTELTVSGCVQQGALTFYTAHIAATGYSGLVPTKDVRWISGPRDRCQTLKPPAEPPSSLRYALGRVYLYAGPGEQYRVVGALQPGDPVRVEACAAGWCTAYGGNLANAAASTRLGYVSLQMLTPSKKQP